MAHEIQGQRLAGRLLVDYQEQWLKKNAPWEKAALAVTSIGMAVLLTAGFADIMGQTDAALGLYISGGVIASGGLVAFAIFAAKKRFVLNLPIITITFEYDAERLVKCHCIYNFYKETFRYREQLLLTNGVIQNITAQIWRRSGEEYSLIYSGRKPKKKIDNLQLFNLTGSTIRLVPTHGKKSEKHLVEEILETPIIDDRSEVNKLKPPKQTPPTVPSENKGKPYTFPETYTFEGKPVRNPETIKIKIMQLPRLDTYSFTVDADWTIEEIKEAFCAWLNTKFFRCIVKGYPDEERHTKIPVKDMLSHYGDKDMIFM